jgi:phosphate starvation-inducible PhoH-like protein
MYSEGSTTRVLASANLLLLTRGGEHGTLLPNGICFHPEATCPAAHAYSCLHSPGLKTCIAIAMLIGAGCARGESKLSMKKNIELRPNVETLFGTRDENLHLLEEGLNVTVELKPNSIQIFGEPADVARVEQVFNDFEYLRAHGQQVFNGELNSMLRVLVSDPAVTLRQLAESAKQRAVGNKRQVQPKSVNQRQYLEAIEQSDMVFGIGPAGTGKTYLAVAMAISALLSKKVARIILARPAVEAGERLGFLPGTLQEKVDPYLRPLYDALYDLLDPEKVDRFLEKNVIEIAPIAFMRGRTLNDSFVILDEAQNTTSEQMKMFVTRLGFNSKAVITGDITQIDLPNASRSGLIEAMNVLQGVEGIRFQMFNETDVVRHQLVQRIIRAYEDFKVRDERQLSLQLEGETVRAATDLQLNGKAKESTPVQQ